MLISWTRDICSLTDFAQERTFSHKLRPKDFSSLCILWCKLSSFGVKKVLSHNLHLWFFVPVWILMCFNKSALSMRDFLQWTQGYDFTPRWTLMWRFNEVFLDICLLNWKHLYALRFTSVCVFLILRVLQMCFDIHCICYPWMAIVMFIKMLLAIHCDFALRAQKWFLSTSMFFSFVHSIQVRMAGKWLTKFVTRKTSATMYDVGMIFQTILRIKFGIALITRKSCVFIVCFHTSISIATLWKCFPTLHAGERLFWFMNEFVVL